MLKPGRAWQGNVGASAEALSKLRAASHLPLPGKLYEFLAFSDGGEGPLPLNPFYFILTSAAVIADNLNSHVFEEFFRGFLIFGSNGGGEYIALDVRGDPPWPVVALDMTNIDIAESLMPLAPSFDEFVTLVGVEATDA
jgi:hypothetical protein